MRARFWLALTLAFGSLFLVNPAEASDWQVTNALVREGSVQFDYRGGTASQTLQAAEGSTLTITVNNTIANCIGNCTPIPDAWSLTINGERWDGNSIDIMTIQTIVSGEVTITATGIDRGFWAGWYGPIISAPIITAPVPIETGTWEGQVFTASAPAGEVFTAVTGWYGAPNDPNCGADVSAILATYLGSNTFTVGSDNGVFGDPCGGVVKVLRVHLTSSAETQSTLTPTPLPSVTAEAPQPETTATPQPEPSPSQDTTEPVMPVVEPVVTPPVVEPQPQPQPIPFPIADPAPTTEPAPKPTAEPAPPTAEPAPPTAEPLPPSAEATPEPAPASPEPIPEATAEPAPTVAPEPPAEAPKPVQPEIKLDLKTVDPETLSPVQQAVITQQAFAVLATAEQGSPAYEQALEALAVVAQADDPELPAELASIPLLGNVAGAVLDTFNAVGNIGADISPKERARGQKIVVGTVIVGQMASVALLRR